MKPIDLNKTFCNLVNTIIPIKRHKNICTDKLTNTASQIKSPATNPNKTNKSKQKRIKKIDGYLKIAVIRIMLKKFLNEKKMAKENLANALGITEEELDQLLFYKLVSKIKQKVNLPLIKLYCETKWL